MEKYVVDTSIIIDGTMVELMEKETVKEVIVPYVVLDELQSQASRGREEGFKGLDELKKIRAICEKQEIQLRFVGDRPSGEDIRLAAGGRLDALIRDVAREEEAVLITADYVQALVGDAEGVKTKYVSKEAKRKELSFKQFFTENTMSIHLKCEAPPYAKKGQPGRFRLVKIRDNPCAEGELKRMFREIIDVARKEEDAFIEVNEGGATVIQLGEYRIAMAKPPFSDGIEITVVRPLVKLRLTDYHLSNKLLVRLRERAEGILIAGPPGSGKTTFASSLADHYSTQGKVTKTLESPRDLQVGPEITQYAPLGGSFIKTASILLMVRPDNVIFDEIRENRDFRVFLDLRLAGVGMVGVIHSTDAVDSIQRFISRTELGMIPSVIDTIIFIKYGKIEEVYDVSLTVRVPTGMIGEDLARPLVEIRNFESGRLEYEVYTFGNENIVVPIKMAGKESPIEKLAAERILQFIKRYDDDAKIQIRGNDNAIVKVDHDAVPKLIGKDGKNISRIEKRLGIHIDVESSTR
jgi:ATPase